MKWRIVAFKHPDKETSVLYRVAENDEALLKAVRAAIAKDTNLMSIRGFEEE